MKKASRPEEAIEDEVLPEYNAGELRGGVRGKYLQSCKNGIVVTVYDGDAVFETKAITPTAIKKRKAD